MATAEANHELGREGVFKVKAWLEATTHLTMPWNVYDHTAVCTRLRLVTTHPFSQSSSPPRRRPTPSTGRPWAPAVGPGFGAIWAEDLDIPGAKVNISDLIVAGQ